ncbi:unnamed protein product [Arabis nemorensis]|uniref:Uncharacterized protein n=1 Tax=Arabis nemorensis TaxID=586526 RepID=A0A565BCX0_9BRAS|nr:unnamed protein product [Arabis nemorensis]
MQCFNEGLFTEALKLSDRAIELDPENAATIAIDQLPCLNWERFGKLSKSVKKLGQVNNARKHSLKDTSDDKFLVMLKQVETHLHICAYARRRDAWVAVLQEAHAAMVSGANLSPQLAMCKVEALLKLQQLHDAEYELALVPKVEPFPASFSQTHWKNGLKQ